MMNSYLKFFDGATATPLKILFSPAADQRDDE
jgi:hypothetical protein